jgi:putative lipoprotein (rSAM/lipoprotein system)
MKSKFSYRRRKIMRTIFGTLSFSSSLFVFQACYGVPQDYGLEVSIQGLVKSKETNLPIQGIKVSVENRPQYEFTDNQGKFKIYTSRDASYNVKFEDVDSNENGSFVSKDTIIEINDYDAYLNVSLDDK